MANSHWTPTATRAKQASWKRATILDSSWSHSGHKFTPHLIKTNYLGLILLVDLELCFALLYGFKCDLVIINLVT